MKKILGHNQKILGHNPKILGCLLRNILEKIKYVFEKIEDVRNKSGGVLVYTSFLYIMKLRIGGKEALLITFYNFCGKKNFVFDGFS